ncbi:MAG: anthranilate phosphoribosyltransferase [Acidobacteria bacterium]|nr:anthranilate phosphoribosyltransferase [Acidobacteriota bacterium]|tara:strand:- start:444 stop:1457 length:1014 start_codon:yes stop_codon:yes gene_type:complete
MFRELIEKLHRRQDLTVTEASAAMAEIMAGHVTPAKISGFLVALSMKGERPSEVVGLAVAMRNHALKLSKRYEDLFDTCGTGGDGGSTFNISSLAALVLAACGVRVAKHGNRAVSSNCGSADFFTSLGVAVDAEPLVVERCLDDCGIGFLFAPRFHPSMRHAAQARRDLGIRTVFNLLGPLANPAMVRRQLVGVPRADLTDLMSRALVELGSERAWVVHGADGLDEVSTTGYTKITECNRGTVRSFYLHPNDFGLRVANPTELRASSPEESLAIAQAVMEGTVGAPRDMVLANAAAGLFITDRVNSLVEGVSVAAAAIDSGSVQSVAAKLVSGSNSE